MAYKTRYHLEMPSETIRKELLAEVIVTVMGVAVLWLLKAAPLGPAVLNVEPAEVKVKPNKELTVLAVGWNVTAVPAG